MEILGTFSTDARIGVAEKWLLSKGTEFIILCNCSGVILTNPSAVTLIVTSTSVSRNTRWCGEAELSGTDGDSYQEGSWSAPGKDGVWLAVINTVRTDRSPPGCTL